MNARRNQHWSSLSCGSEPALDVTAARASSSTASGEANVSTHSRRSDSDRSAQLGCPAARRATSGHQRGKPDSRYHCANFAAVLGAAPAIIPSRRRFRAAAKTVLPLSVLESSSSGSWYFSTSPARSTTSICSASSKSTRSVTRRDYSRPLDPGQRNIARRVDCTVVVRKTRVRPYTTVLSTKLRRVDRVAARFPCADARSCKTPRRHLRTTPCRCQSASRACTPCRKPCTPMA